MQFDLNFDKMYLAKRVFVEPDLGFDIMAVGDKVYTYELFKYHYSTQYEPEDYEILNEEYSIFTDITEAEHMARLHIYGM